MPAEIIAVGAVLLDHIYFLEEEELPRFTHKKGGMELISEKGLKSILEDSKFSSNTFPGGSAVNTIKGLRRLGHSILLFGKKGDDFHGREFERKIKELGIESALKNGVKGTGNVICFVTPDGERTMRTYLGASKELSAEDLDPHLFKGARLLHVEGYTLDCPHVTKEAFRIAKEHHLTISLDLASFEIVEKYRQEIVSLVSNFVDILFCNDKEALALTGLPPQEACQVIQDLVPLSIVTVNKEGAYIGHHGKVELMPAIPVKALDSTGAGDAYMSGFLHGYLKGLSHQESAFLGAKAAHHVVQILGAELPASTWQKIKIE